MDNRRSESLLDTAKQLKLKWDLVSPYVKNPNRSERGIRTAKNHIIATRARFHQDCLPSFLDKCLVQMEMAVNIVRSFEFDPGISAY